MSEKGAKQYLSSQGRKQFCWASDAPKAGQFSQSIWPDRSNGNIFASREWKYIRLKRMEIYSPQANGNIFASNEWKYIRLKRTEIYSPQANGNIFASSEWKYIRLKRMEIYSPQANVVWFQISWSNTKRLYRYILNILCEQPCFIIPLNLGFLILSSYQVCSKWPKSDRLDISTLDNLIQPNS